MKIRLATVKDLQDIVNLWWEMQSYHFKYDLIFYGTKAERISKKYTSEYFKFALVNENHIIILAEEDQKVIGLLHCEISQRPPIFKDGKKANIVEVSVTEHYRGRGIFQQMFNYLKNELQRQNILFCTLQVDKDNFYGIKAYEKCNFQERQKFMICKL